MAGRRVLVVAGPELRGDLVAWLTSAGVPVIEVGSVGAGVYRLEEAVDEGNRVGLVLFDAELPTGAAILFEPQLAEVPAVLLSGPSLSRVERRALMRARAVVEKPIKPEVLVRVVKDLLGRPRSSAR